MPTTSAEPRQIGDYPLQHWRLARVGTLPVRSAVANDLTVEWGPSPQKNASRTPRGFGIGGYGRRRRDPGDRQHTPRLAVDTAGNGTTRAADASASAAAEPLPSHPLEAHLNTLPRAPLMPFDATGRMAATIPFAFDDYLELVDTTGRVIREDKRGYIPGETPRILERLHIDPEQFIATAARMLQQFSTAIGSPEHLTAHCVARNVAFLRGMGAAQALFERKAA